MSATNIPTNFWVKFMNERPIQVSTYDCTFVDDLINAIVSKLRLPYPVADITLHITNEVEALSSDFRLIDIKSQQGLSAATPLFAKSTIESKLEKLTSSDEYIQLRKKNSDWFVKTATDEDKYQWQLLKEKLDQLNSTKQQYIRSFETSNIQERKKTDTVRKTYKNNSSTTSLRELLTEVAEYLYSQYEFETAFANPTFGDVMSAIGFWDERCVKKYFNQPSDKNRNYVPRANTQGLMENFCSMKAWVKLIIINYRVNTRVHSKLKKNKNGKKVLVVDSDLYEPEVFEEIMFAAKSISSKEELDVKIAKIDSSSGD